MNIHKPFQWIEDKGIQLLEIRDWNDTDKVFACFTTRVGGLSEGNYKGLQMGLHVGDSTSSVVQNRQLVSLVAGTPLDRWVAAEQVHGADAAIVTQADAGLGSVDKDTAIPQKDALVTAERGVVLTTFAADCVPLLFYSSEGVIAVAHAGWRGTVKKIAANTVQTMQTAFGCQVETIQVAIGPSIGACCYEVDSLVYQEFRQIGLGHVCKPVDETEALGSHWMLDLWQANKQILREAGILDTNIFVSEQCTSCNTDLYYSHRKEKGKTGRLMGMIYLR